MLELAGLRPGDLLYDLGCGDGRIIVTAAAEFGAKAIGIELRKDLAEKAKFEVKKNSLEQLVRVMQGDFFAANLKEADVVSLYLTPSANAKLKEKLEKELRHGTRVVSNSYEIPGWQPAGAENFWLQGSINYRIFLYWR